MQENDIVTAIEAEIDRFINDMGIEDTSKMPQQKWYWILKQICKMFSINSSLINEDSNGSPQEMYKLDEVELLTEMYVELCMLYDRWSTMWGFSMFSGISFNTLSKWSNRQSDQRRHIYEIINDSSQQSLDGKAVSGSIPVVYAIAFKNNSVWKDNQVSALTGEQKRPTMDIIKRYAISSNE